MLRDLVISPHNKNLQALLILHEGLKVGTYRCPAGFLTIGVGHNLEASPIDGITEGTVISCEGAISILVMDIKHVLDGLQHEIPWFVSMDVVRQAVIVDMAFNMGVHGLMNFSKFMAALSDGFDPGDSAEMFKSKWAFQIDDGKGGNFGRADRLGQMIETGEWPF